MTYGKNLINGYGLNWAKYGQPVEGFTNTLWTFIMIPFNLLPVNAAYKCLAIQVLGLAFHLLMILQVFKIFTLYNPKAHKIILTGLLVSTGFYYPLIYWGLLGMETSIQSFFIMYAIKLYVQIRLLHDKRSIQVSSLLIKLFTVFSFSFFLRYDMALMILVIGFFLLEYFKPHVRTFIKGIIIILLPNLGYFIFRYLYFGDVLPNTWYLKMSGIDVWVRIQRGWGSFLFDTSAMIPWMILLTGWIMYTRKKVVTVCSLVALVYILYSIYIGGDAWDFSLIKGNRFVAVIMPLVLFLCLGMVNSFINKLSVQKNIGSIVSVLVIVLLFLCVNNLNPLKTASYDWKKVFLTGTQMQVAYHKIKLEQTLDLNNITAPTDKVAVIWAGIPAFFGDFQLVDILGYNDRELAHQPVSGEIKDPEEYRPGHMKFNDEYTFGTLGPDYVMELWKTDEFILENTYHYFPETYPSNPDMKYWRKNK